MAGDRGRRAPGSGSFTFTAARAGGSTSYDPPAGASVPTGLHSGTTGLWILTMAAAVVLLGCAGLVAARRRRDPAAVSGEPGGPE